MTTKGKPGPLDLLRFVWSPEADLKLHTAALLTSQILHRNNETGACFPSLNRLADCSHLSRSQVIRENKLLRELSVSQWEHRPGRVNQYTLDPSKIPKTSTTQELVPDRNQYHPDTPPVPPRDDHQCHTGTRTTKGTAKGTTNNNARQKALEKSFEDFYQAYPRKEARQRAFNEWRRLSAKDRKNARAGLDIFNAHWIATNKPIKFIVYAAKFLKERHWDDPPIDGSIQPAKDADLEAMERKAKARRA